MKVEGIIVRKNNKILLVFVSLLISVLLASSCFEWLFRVDEYVGNFPFLNEDFVEMRLRSICLFAVLFVLVFKCSSIWYSVMRQNEYTKASIRKYVVGYIIIVAMFVLFWGMEASISFGMVSFFVITILIRIEKLNTWKYDSYWGGIRNLLLLLLSAIIQFYIVETINGNISSIGVKYIIGNSSIYLVIFWLIYILFRKVSISIGIGMILISGFAIANYYVTLFRGTPIVPGDFFLLETARTIVSNYQYEATPEIFFSVVLITVWEILLILMEKELSRISYKNVLSGMNIVLALFISILTFDMYKPPLDFWNLNNSISTYGVGVCLVANIREMGMKEPEGYSREEIENNYKQYLKKEEMGNNFPNIIVVMNESFSDMSILDERLDSDMHMPYFKSLNNVVRGSLLVSALGGGTANTEYEFLTGNTMSFIPGSIPYQQYIVQEAHSWVWELKKLDYYAVAIHPFSKTGYNRHRVYPNLGFDEFVGLEEFDSAELTRGVFVSDKESYNTIINKYELIKEQNKKAFIFNVTMQNHSAYNTGYFLNDSIQVPGAEGHFADVEEYLTLIKKSDESIHLLIDYFEKIEEPTVILFFGDHQPQLSDLYYSSIKPLEQWSWEELQRRYIVPFFIWANFDIEDKEGVITSPNYLSGMVSQIAGIPTTAYQKLLLSIQEEIPAMNVNAYLTNEGKWVFYDEKLMQEGKLKDYRDIQYNNIFDKHKVDEWFILDGYSD